MSDEREPPDETHPSPPEPEEPGSRLDNWANPTTGQGMYGVDNRLSWVPYARSRNQRRQRDMWLGDGLAGTIVERPPSDMTRARGVVKLGEGMADAEQTLQAIIEELSVWPSAAKALKYDRAYGGGALVMAADDGMAWSEPVDAKRLRRVRALIPATPDELQAEKYFNNPERSAEYGKPALYRWRPRYIPGIDGKGLTDRLVHASRVIAFTGLDVDNEHFVENGGWGASLLDRCEEPLRDTASALAGIGTGLNRFSQEVLGMKELNRILGDKQGKQRLAERVQDMKLYQSILGVLLIDKDESYERKPLSMAGVADTLKTLFQRLAAVSSMPIHLFGVQEAGLGDTGQSAIETWHAWVNAERNNRLRPGLEKLIRLILLSKEGPTGGVEPPHWKLEFGPLAEPTQAEKDGQRKLQAEIDQIYITNQVVSPADVARSRFSGPDGFSTTTEVDMSAFEALPPAPADEPGEEPPAPGATTPAPGGQLASASALNGSQVEATNGIIERVALRLLPRASGVEQLVGFFGLSREQAERMIGEVGRTFFAVVPGEEQQARVDSAAEYAELLVRELEQGALAEAEVVRKVARLYRVEPRQAHAIIRRLRGQHQDATERERTNFPRPGEDKKVSLRNSRWQVFDPAYAADLKENWPEVWRLGGNVLGNTQFQRLLPMARGAAVDTPLEEHALRLREAWAARHERNKRPAGVVALVKWLVVGRQGEARMKALLEAEKDKVRRRREQGGAE